VPFGLRPTVSAASAEALLGLLGWFGTKLIAPGGQIGLAERVLAEAPTVWPLAVVPDLLAYISCLGTAPQARRP
jgi:hypothetical protein